MSGVKGLEGSQRSPGRGAQWAVLLLPMLLSRSYQEDGERPGTARNVAFAGVRTAKIINDPLHHQAFSRFTRPAGLLKRENA
jgi:hypothetical protein